MFIGARFCGPFLWVYSCVVLNFLSGVRLYYNRFGPAFLLAQTRDIWYVNKEIRITTAESCFHVQTQHCQLQGSCSGYP